MMKKLTASLLVISLLFGGLSVTFAVDYREQALELLAAKLQVPAESIKLEGSLTELPFTGEHFWIGRYSLGENALEKPAVDDHDQTVSSDLAADVVYLRIKSGELLSYEAAQVFFDEEGKLHQAEIERLAQESGKIDPYLYQKIIAADEGKIFEVFIWLKYVETASMKKIMEEIAKEYPEFADILIPPEYSGRTLPAEPSGVIDLGPAGGGVTGSSGGANGATKPAVKPDLPGNAPVAEGESHILPYPGPETLPLPKGDIAEDPAFIDDRDWTRYEEMMNRLTEVRAQGYADSFSFLQEALNSMGVAFEVKEGNAVVRTKLTGSQMISLKDADYIESIAEDMIFFAKDGMERSLAVEDNAAKNAGRSILPWVLTPVLLLLAGGGSFYWVRRLKFACRKQL